ncbi:MAG: DUF1156 domain-containing protein [Phycisphaerales bacterium]|nr:DUF1156 domain-containing protein [Phycisphaerales bacterium]
MTEIVRKPKEAKEIAVEHLPPNLAQPVKVKVPDFSDPKRPKTCLEVDFPIVPINALSALEGNAGKPIYQMSKWWARRRSSIFRAILIAAAMEAPTRKGADGEPIFDENGVPEPDLDEAHRAVWDVFYANHQKAENFRHLKVLDCFMGGGTTMVEGSRLGFQMSGVDLNPVAWFVTKNELAHTDPKEVERLFDAIEAEVKPQIQPFYVTDCPRGHEGKWFDVESSKQVDIDPAALSPEERKKYRYEGPEVIYTFWGKHGPCVRPDCDHRTPIFRTPVIAEKTLGVKYMDLTCKQCKTAFHAELGNARMAPGAERVVLDNEHSFTELSQPFAKRLLDYAKGNKNEKFNRVFELLDLVEDEPGLRCPACGSFAGEWVRNVLKMHKGAQRVSGIDKKHLKILPARNSTKAVYCYLLIHPDWLKGASGMANGLEMGGYINAPIEDTAAWYENSIQTLKLIEVRGQIKLAEDTSHLDPAGENESEPEAYGTEPEPDVDEKENEAVDEGDNNAKDRKIFGLPRFITLSNGLRVDTRRGTVPKRSTVACGSCGQPTDILRGVVTSRKSAPLAPYALQGHCPECDEDGQVYNGRFFKALNHKDIDHIVLAKREWKARRESDLASCWPTSEIPPTKETVQHSLQARGYTHWWMLFDDRQLLGHALLLRSMIRNDKRHGDDVRRLAIGAFQQYLRNQCMLCFWNIQRDTPEPHFSGNNYHPKHLVIENCVFHALGRGNMTSSFETTLNGLKWSLDPWDILLADHNEANKRGLRVHPGDPVADASEVWCGSATDLSRLQPSSLDLVVTDPPFGNNVFYADLADFFFVWLKCGHQLISDANCFDSEYSPRALEAIHNHVQNPESPEDFYRTILTQCYVQCFDALKAGGILAFTFHHSQDEPWIAVLRSLFDSRFILEATFPIRSDESKGEGGKFGARLVEYDIIHVCRKRLDEPQPVSWPKMRQWVKAELKRLRQLLESYKARELSDADIRVILRGKALEFYSRHYGKVYTAEDAELSIRDALLGINQLLDEDTGEPGERPPSILQPVCYQFLRLFGGKASLSRDDVGKSLRGTGMVQREFVERGWVEEKNKFVYRVPIKEHFEKTRLRPRKEMKTEIDQAHFLIGAALPGSGLNIEEELSRNTWAVRRSVEAVLQWYAKTAVEPEIADGAELAATLLRTSLEQRRSQLVHEQGFLFDDLEEVT